MENTRVERLSEFLKQRSLLEEYEEFLPTPDFVRNIIFFTNDGRIEKAVSAVQKMHQIASLLDNELHDEDKQWLSAIVIQLENSIASARNS